MLEPYPHPLHCCHAIPFADFQSELSRPVKKYLGYVHSFVLGVRRSSDVGELNKFFNGGEKGRYWVSMIVDCLLDDVFALDNLMGHRLTIVVLKVFI